MRKWANAVTHAVGSVPYLSYSSYQLFIAMKSMASCQLLAPFLSSVSFHVSFINTHHSMSYGSTHKYIPCIIDHSMIYIAIVGSSLQLVLALMNNWLGYLIILTSGEQQFWYSLQNFAKRSMRSLVLLLSYDGLAGCLFIIPPIISQTSPLFLGIDAGWRPCYTIGAGFYAKKTLFPYDLASLYSCRLCFSIHRYCLYHVIHFSS